MSSLIPCTTCHAAAFCRALSTSGKRWDGSIKTECPLTKNIIFPRPFFLPPTHKQQTWSSCQRWENTAVFFSPRDLSPFYERICPTLRKLHICTHTHKASFDPFIQQQQTWRNDLHNDVRISRSGSSIGRRKCPLLRIRSACEAHIRKNFQVNSDFLRKRRGVWAWQIRSRVGLLSPSISHSQRRADSFIPPAEREV